MKIFLSEGLRMRQSGMNRDGEEETGTVTSEISFLKIPRILSLLIPMCG